MVVFPDPVGPTSAAISPGSIEAYSSQHRRLGVVAERHMIEFDATRKRRSQHGARQVLHIALGLHHLLYAFPRHRCFRVSIGHLRKLLHRLVHLSQRQDENNQRTCRETAVQNQRAPNHSTMHAAGHDHFTIGESLPLAAGAQQCRRFPCFPLRSAAAHSPHVRRPSPRAPPKAPRG